MSPRSAKSSRRPPSQRMRSSWLKNAVTAVLIVGGMGGMGLAVGVGLVVAQIPPVSTLLAEHHSDTTKIYDHNNRLVASLQNGENRQTVPLSAISLPMQKAVVASEDEHFYQHYGIDPAGVLRAVLSFGMAGGGSTITQQLAKNLFLSFDRTLTRKVADMWLAIQLERTLTKQQILAMYLNQIYYGHGAWGVESASQAYFGKHASELTLNEAALLTGMLPAPEYYSPDRHPQAAKEVRDRVLRRMAETGAIDEATATREIARPLPHTHIIDYAYPAPYFTSQVLQALTDKFGADLVMRGGLKIYTTLDLPEQQVAERLIRSGVAADSRYHVGEGALVAIEPGTGAVRALVGGTSYSESQFNRATQAHRQPGSTFKPFVYLTAFMQGYTPFSTVIDAPVRFGNYAPVNDERTFQGKVTFLKALTQSLNVPTVKVADQIGIDNVIRTAHAAGIKSDLPENLSVALGSAEVTPLELASAYATFAADGLYVEPHLIDRVEDKDGHVLEQFTPSTTKIADPVSVAELDECLQNVIYHGTGTAAWFGRPAAGKTGTTSGNRDTWFAGYTPDLACVVWLGNDDDSRLSPAAYGGVLAAPLWSRFMGFAHEGVPVHNLIKIALPSAPDATDSAEPASDTATSTAATDAAPVASAPANALQGQPLQEPLPSDAPTAPAEINLPSTASAPAAP
ncbi:MAG TPA: PBP1A family penicillin-binding protein [Oscillatoriaceae cyanobacterium]